MSNYVFRPAALDGVGVFGCIAGTSRSGKTLTALRVARGIAGPQGKIAAIDTEGRRMEHYAAHPREAEVHGEGGAFKYHFDVYEMQSPFDPLRFCDIASEAEGQGYDCLVIDSFSLEWSGIGGVRDRYDQFMMGKGQNLSDKGWDFAKAPHKKMRDRLLQSRMPIIFCIRCNLQAKHLAGGREGTWRMEQDQRFIYEWTFSLTMHPNTPGVPRYDLKTPTGEDAWKMSGMFRPWFPPEQFITEEAGDKIREWRTSHATDKLAARRTVREIVHDRCVAAGDEADVKAVEDLPAVQKALADAPEQVKTEIRQMLAGARARIAKERASAQSQDDGDSRGAGGSTEQRDPDAERAQSLAGQFAACATLEELSVLRRNPRVAGDMDRWKAEKPALWEIVDAADGVRKGELQLASAA